VESMVPKLVNAPGRENQMVLFGLALHLGVGHRSLGKSTMCSRSHSYFTSRLLPGTTCTGENTMLLLLPEVRVLYCTMGVAGIAVSHENLQIYRHFFIVFPSRGKRCHNWTIINLCSNQVASYRNGGISTSRCSCSCSHLFSRCSFCSRRLLCIWIVARCFNFSTMESSRRFNWHHQTYSNRARNGDCLRCIFGESSCIYHGTSGGKFKLW
jgi:hypothetical protein